MINLRNAFIYWLPPVAYMIFISPMNDLLTSHSTSSLIMPLITWFFPDASQHTSETLHILLRKTGHFLEYAFLAFLLFRGFRGSRKTYQYTWILYAGLISLGYSALDECLQTFIPARTGSFYDWLIDSSGIACSIGMLLWKKKREI
ncbi:MAG: putative rane protein [Nitrospirae bacterium]|jgi:VanZ family protein|nr:putative rane protein [Nitrospirota bacterium]